MFIKLSVALLATALLVNAETHTVTFTNKYVVVYGHHIVHH